MGTDSKIEWTHHTFNPWWGCEKVSPACEHCYAEAFSKRTGHAVWGGNAPRRFFGDKHWNEPLKWDAAAKAAGQRKRVFCASMADVFEDRDDLDEHRLRLLTLIDDTPNLDWLLLTKRPETIVPIMDRVMHGNFDLDLTFKKHMPNVWLGTTVENQSWAEKRIPVLLSIPATVRFLSCEPLLGALDLRQVRAQDGSLYFPLAGEAISEGMNESARLAAGGIDWVICGGESGAKARPMNPEWAENLRDQCVDAGVPFFFKQWGEWSPWDFDSWNPNHLTSRHLYRTTGDLQFVYRTGKTLGGRKLQAQAWDEFPSK